MPIARRFSSCPDVTGLSAIGYPFTVARTPQSLAEPPDVPRYCGVIILEACHYSSERLAMFLDLLFVEFDRYPPEFNGLDFDHDAFTRRVNFSNTLIIPTSSGGRIGRSSSSIGNSLDHAPSD